MASPSSAAYSTPGDLWEAVGIGYYEALFVSVLYEQLAPWLSPFVVDETRHTYVLGLDGEGWSNLKRLVGTRADHAYWTHMYAAGAIENL